MKRFLILAVAILCLSGCATQLMSWDQVQGVYAAKLKDERSKAYVKGAKDGIVHGYKHGYRDGKAYSRSQI